MKLYILLWFLISAISAAIPIPLIKKYTETKNIIWIFLSILSYFVLILSYSVILDDNNITILYPLLKVLSIFIVIFSGIIFFNNKLDMKSLIGILFGIISIYLLSSKINR